MIWFIRGKQCQLLQDQFSDCVFGGTEHDAVVVTIKMSGSFACSLTLGRYSCSSKRCAASPENVGKARVFSLYMIIRWHEMSGPAAEAAYNTSHEQNR